MNTSGKESPASYVVKAPHRAGREAELAIVLNLPFVASNTALRGEKESFRDPGALAEPHRSAFCKATWREGQESYVVRSYETPIAWHTDGEWVTPDVRYSATTSRHQAVVRHAIANAESAIDVAVVTVELGESG